MYPLGYYHRIGARKKAHFCTIKKKPLLVHSNVIKEGAQLTNLTVDDFLPAMSGLEKITNTTHNCAKRYLRWDAFEKHCLLSVCCGSRFFRSFATGLRRVLHPFAYRCFDAKVMFWQFWTQNESV